MTTTLTAARSTTSRTAPSALQLIRQAVATETDVTPATSATTAAPRPDPKPATTTTPPVLTSTSHRQANPATPAAFSAAQIAAL